MPAETDPPFEADLAELDRVLKDLEDGSTTLDASLARYEQGVHLLRRCYARLQTAEQKIQQLTGLDDAGKPVLEPFAHAPAAGKGGRRARGESA